MAFVRWVFLGVLYCLYSGFLSSLWALSPVALTPSFEQIPLGEHLEILEDPTRQLTLEQIQAPPNSIRFASNSQEVPSFGITNSAYWVRFQLVNQRPDQRFFLEMGLPGMEKVDLYSKSLDGTWLHRSSGQLRPFSVRDLGHPHFVFELNIHTNSTETYYMRVHSIRGTQIPLALWEPKAFSEYSTLSMFAQGLFFGALIIMVFYNLFVFFSVRDISYFYYVVYITLFTLFVLSLRGFSPQLLWTDSPWWAGQSILVLANSSVIGMLFFSRAFLHTSEDLPQIDNLIKLLILFGLFCVALSFFRLLAVAKISSVFLISTPILILFLSIYRWKSGFSPARFFVIAWVTLVLGFLIFVLQRIGLFPKNILSEYAIQIGALLEVSLLSFALADRINILRKEKELAQSKTVDFQIKMTTQLEKRIHQRTQELKKAADESEQANKQLLIANKELKETQSQLVQSAKLASLGEMATGVAHELNQPLIIIGLNIELALDDPSIEGNEEMKNNLSIINGQVYRAAKIVSHLKTFGRDTSKAEFRPTEINKVVENTFILIKEQFNLRDIHITVILSEIALYSMGVGIELEQVLSNLLINARDAMEKSPKKELHVRTFQEGDRNLIEISDTGYGISDKHLDKIFDPFFTTKKVGEGTGLGLSISHGLIQKHHGHIEVESIPQTDQHSGKTTFRIILPMVASKN